MMNKRQVRKKMLPTLLSEPGPLLAYIMSLEKMDARKASDVRSAVRAALSTPDGRMLMELLEKATISTPTKILADPRALAARNSQAFIASDLRRILSDEHEKLVEQKQSKVGGPRRNAIGRPAAAE
jgi:hypothetical protein